MGDTEIQKFLKILNLKNKAQTVLGKTPPEKNSQTLNLTLSVT